MKKYSGWKFTQLLVGTALVSSLGMAVSASAQEEQPQEDERATLQKVVVTAQKREQDLQNVPVAVTALTDEALEVNRVTDVTDLTGLAPGVTVRTSAGGSKLPSFIIRGVVSYGVVPGSDKQVSQYLDGVYISSPRGSIFSLPDVQRIEVLRGPQGTLFGRNATAGAISISTRDPKGEFGVKAKATVGNRDQERYQISVDTAEFGPLSAYVSYVDDYKRGDIRNASAGQAWDRTASASPDVAKTLTSPEYLGTKDSQSLFGAVRFEMGDFETVYKYDKTEDSGTPEGTALLGYNTDIPLVSDFITALISSQPTPVNIAPSGERPDVVNNAWVIPSTLEVEGHSLTSTYQITNNLSVKNILAHRESYLFATSSIDGFSSLTFTPEALVPYATFVTFSQYPSLALADQATQAAAIGATASALAPLIGSPFVTISNQAENRSEQTSDEIQFNYDSDFLTATVGALWFESEDRTGQSRLQNTLSFAPVYGGILTQTNTGETFNEAKSTAAYAQLEFHLTDRLDIVGGYRITKDEKSGTLTYGTGTLSTISFDYEKTRPSYLIGVNYAPADDVLVYGKYSTAFVSGGSVGGITFRPETAESFEAGVKAEFFNNTLRTNLALYSVEYNNFQTAQVASNFTDQITEITGDPTRAASIGTFIVDQGGPVKTDGAEFEWTAAWPVSGLTSGGSWSYQDTSFEDVNPVLLAVSGGVYEPALRPEQTLNLWTNYQTGPLFGTDAYVSAGFDASWQSDVPLAQNPNALLINYAPAIKEIPSYWMINGRVALNDYEIGGVNTQVALWGRNLTDEGAIGFGLDLSSIFASANYIPARSFGVDFTVEF